MFRKGKFTGTELINRHLGLYCNWARGISLGDGKVQNHFMVIVAATGKVIKKH